MLTITQVLALVLVHAGIAVSSTGGTACPQAFGTFGPGHLPAACWRPYGSDSVFNRTIPARPHLASSSGPVGTYMRAARWNFPVDTHGRLALRSDGDRPIYWSRADDPIVRVTCTGDNGICQKGMFPLKLRIPSGASPAAGSDAHLTVVNQQSDWEYDFWKAHFVSPSHLEVASGCRLREGPGAGSGLHGCAEASGFGLQAGLIRAAELSSGHINHALAVSVPCTAAHRYVWPATYPSGYDCPPGVAGPPLGALLRLNMSRRAINGSHAPSWQKAILTALSRYGMYVVDTEGGGTTMELISESDLSYRVIGPRGAIGSFIAASKGYYYATNHDWILDGTRISLKRFQMIAPCQMRDGCR